MALKDYVKEGQDPQGLREYAKRSQLLLVLKEALTEKLGFQTLLSIIADNDADQARSELLLALRSILHQDSYDEFSELDKHDLAQELIDELVGLGPLETLLKDPEVSEIMVNGCASLFYEQKGRLYHAQHVFRDEAQIRLIIDRILAPLGRRIDEQSPLVNARLSSGYRVNAVIPPISLEGPLLTIRKFSDRISELSELIRMGSISPSFAQLLSWAVKARKNIAVVGGTGSGKTTLLNALSCEIPHEERIITIEDSAELKFKTHPHVIRLERRDPSIEGLGEVSIKDLVINSLRMRPDRIVVGECRGAETIDMLQAMNTGHDGSLTSLHAGSAQEAIVRLILLARYGIDLPSSVIEDQIATALDFIVMQSRMSDGSRKVTGLSAVSRKAGGGVELEELLRFDEEQQDWHILSCPSFIYDLETKGIANAREVKEWQQSCCFS